jgi:hypothetical protein
MVNPVITKITFIGHAMDWMEEPHAVRAGHYTVTAADAPLPVHQHNSVGILISRAHRTYLDTGRFFALVAKFGNEKSLFYFFRRNIFKLTTPQIDPAGSKSVPRLFRTIGQYFSFSVNDISFNPGPGDTGIKGDFVFQFTGFYAEAATDAFIDIDEKCKANRQCPGLDIVGPENSVQSFDQHQGSGPFYGQFNKISPVHLYLLTGFGCLMRIVTEHTFQPGIVLIRVDAFDLRSLAVGIEKTGMAPKAELPATVKVKFQRISRMGKSRSVTVFTFNIFMLCGSKFLHLCCMAGLA